MSERPAEPVKDVAWIESQLSAGALQDHLEAAVNKAVDEKPDNLSQRVAEHLLLASVPPVARPELFAAALLVARAGEGYEGLAETLRQLAEKPEIPEQLSAFVQNRLHHWRRRAAVRAQKTPVLPGLQMKCDEFDGIHALSSERVHPQVWNWRKMKTADGLPIYGAGQCHLDGLVFLARQLKEAGYRRVFWFNMREEPLVFLNGTACAPRVEGKVSAPAITTSSIATATTSTSTST
jgi:hypothetical protein